MIVVMQLIFCTVRDFLKAITSKSIEHESKEENNVLDLIKESPAPKKRRVVCNFSMSPADCHKVHTEQAENTCEHKYLNVISERNPSVSKEFLENLERRTANRSDTLQLAQLSHKTENTAKNEDNSEVSSTWCEQSHNVDCSSQKAEEVTERFDTEEPPKRFPATLLSDRDWLDEFEYLFAAGLLDELKETLKRSFDENKNPFDFVLFIMTFADHDIFSGKKSLVHIALTEFESWIENENKRMGETGRELLMPTKEQQDSALEIVVSSKLLFFETIKRLYKLDCGNNQFLEKHIRYLLSTGRRYKEAATFATKLNLQTQFEPSEMLLPLLILDKLQLAESYIMSSVWHQRAYLSMIDDLCGMEDEQLQQIVDSANIYPKPKENKLKNKILVKIGERLIKKFHLNGEDYPNVFKEKNLSGLRYLLNKKYTERNAPPKKWDNLIEGLMSGYKSDSSKVL